MLFELLDHGILVEEESHVTDDDVVHICQKFIARVVSKLPRSEGIEAANAPKYTSLLGKFLIDECSDRFECNKPSTLDVVHWWDK